MIDRSLNYGRHHIRKFLSDSMPYSLVVDLGAGLGCDLELARSMNGNAELHAIEASSGNAEALAGKGINAHFLNIERDSLPFQDGSVDVVIANQVLEHTKEIYWICHEISRVLKLGGHLIVGVPNLASLHNRILLLFGRQPTPIQSSTAHVRGFTKHDLLKFTERIFPDGYSQEGFGGSNFYPFPPVLAKRLAIMFPNLAWGIFFNLKKAREYRDEFIAYPVAEKLETNFYLGDS